MPRGGRRWGAGMLPRYDGKPKKADRISFQEIEFQDAFGRAKLEEATEKFLKLLQEEAEQVMHG